VNQENYAKNDTVSMIGKSKYWCRKIHLLACGVADIITFVVGTLVVAIVRNLVT
jgi:hypothetical protein